ncbi:hypothetical protein ABE039_24690 [Priestia megaterium]
MKKKVLVSSMVGMVMLLGVSNLAPSPLTATKVEATEKTATQIWGDAKWYYNNKNYFNAVYYGGDAINKGYKGTDTATFMQNASQALFNSATESSNQKDYKLAYKHYNLLAITTGVPADLKKQGAKYAEISKRRDEDPVAANYFNQAQWYYNQESYYNALYYITKTIESGWNTDLIKQYVNDISAKMIEEAEYSITVDSKDITLKYSNKIIDNPYVPKAYKDKATKLKANLFDVNKLSANEKQLVARGYPIEDLIYLTNSEEQTLVSEDATYLKSEEVVDTDSNLNDVDPGDIPQNNSQVSLLATNTSGDLKNFSHKIIASQLPTLKSGSLKDEKRIRLSYNFTWYSSPVYTMTDRFAIVWNNNYQPYTKSANFEYTYYTKNGIYNGARSSGEDSVYEYAKGNMGGFWKFNIKGGMMNGKFINKHKGTASIVITKEKKIKETSSKVFYKSRYFHNVVKPVSGQLSAEASKGAAPSISITFESRYLKSNEYGKSITPKSNF